MYQKQAIRKNRRTVIRGLSRFTVMLLFSFFFLVVPARAGEINSSTGSVIYSNLSKQLIELLSHEKGTYGIYVIDLHSGQWLGINHQEPFHAASTFKLPLNIYLHEQIAAGKVDPLTYLTYRAEHREGGTGRLQFKPVGSKFRIETLSRYSIVYSDNVATNILLSYLGRTSVKNFMHSLGGTVVSDKQNITCPRDMAIYMQYLLNFAAAHPREGNTLLNYLENTIYNERLPAPLPDGIKVAHKTGNWPATGTYNDVGYVRHPQNPYIISVFSKNTAGQERAFQVIRRISRLVYDYQNKIILVKIFFNGQEVQADVPPLLDGGTLLVPLRAVATALGAQVHWDGLRGTIDLKGGGTALRLQVGSKTVTVNGRESSLPAPPQLMGGRTMVPLRFIGEAFGAQVKWDGDKYTVDILRVSCSQ